MYACETQITNVLLQKSNDNSTAKFELIKEVLNDSRKKDVISWYNQMLKLALDGLINSKRNIDKILLNEHKMYPFLDTVFVVRRHVERVIDVDVINRNKIFYPIY